ESKVTWTGVSDADQARMEIQLEATLKNLPQSVDVPLIMKDNKMYFSIPSMTQDGEFFSLTSKKLKLPGETIAKSLSMIVDSVDSSWLDKDDNKKNSQYFQTIIIKI